MMLWLYVTVTIIDALVSAGFSIAGVVAPGLVYRPAAYSGAETLVFALYAAARSVPLALIVLLAASRRAWPVLTWLGALVGLVQLCDAWVGLVGGDPVKVAGPAVTALLQLWACLSMRRLTVKNDKA